MFSPRCSRSFRSNKFLRSSRNSEHRTVELGTGNYPGDPHCKLSMLNDLAALKDFKQKLADYGFSISALSSPRQSAAPGQSGGQGLSGDQQERLFGWRKNWKYRW